MRILLTAFSERLRSDVISAEELGLNPEKPGQFIYLPFLPRMKIPTEESLNVPDISVIAGKFEVVRIEQYGPGLEHRYAHYRFVGLE